MGRDSRSVYNLGMQETTIGVPEGVKRLRQVLDELTPKDRAWIGSNFTTFAELLREPVETQGAREMGAVAAYLKSGPPAILPHGLSSPVRYTEAQREAMLGQLKARIGQMGNPLVYPERIELFMDDEAPASNEEE